MNPLAILVSFGTTLGIAGIVSYLVYRHISANTTSCPEYNFATNRTKPNSLGTCTICLEGIDIQTQRTLRCNHMFHRTCILEWRKNQATCPVCRRIM